MAARVVLAPRARADLFAMDSYLAERNPLAAERLSERLLHAMQTLARMPGMGRSCADLGLSSVRRFVVEQHHIFYMPTASGIQVVRVIHGRRDVPSEVRQ
jgi:plasmid stabilization system protein ParE